MKRWKQNRAQSEPGRGMGVRLQEQNRIPSSMAPFVLILLEELSQTQALEPLPEVAFRPTLGHR